MLSSFVPKSVWSDLSSLRTLVKLAVQLVSMSLAIVGDVVLSVAIRFLLTEQAKSE